MFRRVDQLDTLLFLGVFLIALILMDETFPLLSDLPDGACDNKPSEFLRKGLQKWFRIIIYVIIGSVVIFWISCFILYIIE